MKHKMTRKVLFEGKQLTFDIEYWPSYPATQQQPEEPAEINILTITDMDGNVVQVPDCQDDGGDGTWEKMVEVLLTDIVDENAAMATIAVEEWD